MCYSSFANFTLHRRRHRLIKFYVVVGRRWWLDATGDDENENWYENVAEIETNIQATQAQLAELGVKDDPQLELAMELEKIALNDEYFADRKLFPNVDFYSGIILRAMGFPTSMFTVLFAVARTVGWISQWKEMIEEPSLRIGRPRQLYTGPEQRPYVPLKSRK